MPTKKRCSFCGEEKPVNQFYKRKKGLQAGQTTAYCMTCNTDAVRYATYRQRYQAGTLQALIDDLKARIEIAERVMSEAIEEDRNKRALAIGLKILAEKEKESK